MSIINYYNSPTVINWNLDQNGQQVSLPIQNETKQVVEGKIPLEGLPDEQYRVAINGYVEIGIKDRIDSPNKFKCDYTHGVLYFDQSKNGESINITKYYSRGGFYIPAQRVYTKINNFGEVVETLDNVVDDIANLSDQITVIADIAQNANTVKNDLQQGIADGTVLKSNLDTSISTATAKKTQLDASVSTANASKTELDTSIGNASTSKSNLDTSIESSATSKNNLDSSILSGNTLKINLDGSISTGTTLKSDLDTNIIDGNELKLDLQPLTDSANIAKTELNDSIATSIIKKSDLDESISSAITKKTDLDNSISNANTINNTLSDPAVGTIKKATDINTALDTNIDVATTKNTDLQDVIDISHTSKINLQSTTDTANTTKINLDGSIATGQVLKGELDQIIAGTDFEQIIVDIDSLKTDQHNHSNKTVLDGLSDIGGKLEYNSLPIGAGDMAKSVYDTNNNGKVDIAEDAEKLGGQLPSYYAKQSDMDNKVDNSRVLTDVPADAKFTDTITPIANNLTETVAGKALDSTQGKVLDDKIGILNGVGATKEKANKEELESHKAESVHQYEELKFSELSSIATNVDSEGIYVNSEWKRADNTTYAKSTLLGTTPNYNQIKIEYYDKLGATIIKTITWNLTYDGNDFAYQREVV